jgi:flavin-dependent thymidylate synthase
MTQPVELIEIFGDDITAAEAAWYSTAKEVTSARRQRVPALLEHLAQGDPPEGLPHSVPFEHTLISFRVTSEIASHIHVLKHRIGVSVSSQSQRYMELREDTYYTPDDWPEDIKEAYRRIIEKQFAMYHQLIADLEAAGIDRKRAKESARFVLPYATQIRYRVTFNLLSFVHFLKLRNSEHAQKEIREIAAEMLRLVKESGRFENSLRAWGI